MRKAFFGVVAVALCLSLTGCAAVLIGAGVAGGFAISKDTAKLERDTSYRRAWSASLDVIEDMGVVESHDKTAGTIEATVQGAKINATVSQLTDSTVQVTVKARKNLLPKINLAMDIVNRIGKKI